MDLALTESDKQLLSRSASRITKILGLDPSVNDPHPDPLQLLRLYDNLSRQFGGDWELMRHWVHSGNSHLEFTPALRTHQVYWLERINEYLESFLTK